MNLPAHVYHVDFDHEDKIMIYRDYERRFCQIQKYYIHFIYCEFEYPSDAEYKQVYEIHKQKLISMNKQHKDYCPIPEFKFFTKRRKSSFYYNLFYSYFPLKDIDIITQIEKKKNVIETIKHHRFHLRQRWNEPKVIKRNHRRVMRELKMTPNGMQVQIDKYGFNRVMKKYGY